MVNLVATILAIVFFFLIYKARKKLLEEVEKFEGDETDNANR